MFIDPFLQRIVLKHVYLEVSGKEAKATKHFYIKKFIESLHPSLQITVITRASPHSVLAIPYFTAPSDTLMANCAATSTSCWGLLAA